MIKIAHISDLHFFHPTFGFSPKRLLGNINFLINRRKIFFHERLEKLVSIFKNESISHVVITGDLTTTSAIKEFEQAQKFVQSLQNAGFPVFTIPGNHDTYTQKAYRDQTFYKYFPSQWQTHDLKNQGFTTHKLNHHWRLIGLDNTIATPLFCSFGVFSVEIEKNLTNFLHSIDKNEKIILINHFPFFQKQSKRKELKRYSSLKDLILQFSQIKLYCHGHTHTPCLIDLQHQNLPIILNSGCTPYKIKGGWHKLELLDNQLFVEIFNWKNHNWESVEKKHYDLV